MVFMESTRRYILLVTIGIIILGIIVANVMGKNQDEQFATEDLLYQQALQQYEANEYSEASLYINELLTKKSNSEAATYLGALIAANTNDMTQAATLMQKTLDLNPYRVEDALFMLQLGEIFYNAKRFEEAKVVLDYCQKSGWEPEEYPNYQEKVAELLSSLENTK